VNRALDDGDLASFVDTLAKRPASFDRETLGAAKTQINRFGMPVAAELQSSNDMFFSILALPGTRARRAKVRNVGYGAPSDFELNFGSYLPKLGRADDDDTDAKRLSLTSRASPREIIDQRRKPWIRLRNSKRATRTAVWPATPCVHFM
jgi:hypothetical protein